MSEAFVKIDLHGLRQEEAMKVIDKAIASAGPATYQLQLIRCGTCGNSTVCDYLVVGSRNPIAEKYETVTDEQGFLVSIKKTDIKGQRD